MWRVAGSGGAAFANGATAARGIMLDASQSCITLGLRCIAVLIYPDGRIGQMDASCPALSQRAVIYFVGGDEEAVYPA